MKPTAASPHDHLLYQDQELQIGRFWASSNEHGFADTGPIENHVLVFPSLPVEICYSHQESVVADSMLAMCYNRGCEYRRRALNSQGDLCWWIAYEDSLLAGAMGTSAESPFRQRWVPVPKDAFMVMRALVTELLDGGSPDPLQLGDSAWWLIGRCLEGPHTPSRANRQQELAVQRARAFVAQHFRESISLSDLAHTARMSPFHLSRVFHRVVGKRLHQYLVELRLRESVQEIVRSTRSLTDIGLDMGFSTPSHFSTAFKKTFGIAPSQLRKDQWARLALKARAIF